VLRVLRGGSFFYNLGSARCAARDGRLPLYRLWDYGFRVVVSRLPALHSGTRHSGTLG
jgi:formylglycine-generating enzyme required for sulfatase activity